MITILAQADDAAATGSAWQVLLLYAVIIGGLVYFLMIRPRRNEMRRHQQLVDSLAVGDEIVTIGGIYGRIDFLDEESAVLQVEGGGRLKVARRALARKISE
jgi:preprotein translocase subunit YajC